MASGIAALGTYTKVYEAQLRMNQLEAKIKSLAGGTFNARAAAMAIVTSCGDDINPNVIVRLISREGRWQPAA